jgi:hypothetical protein
MTNSDNSDVKEAVEKQPPGIAIKLDGALRNFDGSGSVNEFLSKFKIIRRFAGWQDYEALQVLVLKLEGKALAVYLNMDEKSQLDYNLVYQKLMNVFSENPEGAMTALLTRRFIPGESPEALYAELAAYVRTTAVAPLSETAVFNLVMPHFVRIVPAGIRAMLKLSKPSDPESLVSNTRLLLTELPEITPDGHVGAVRHERKTWKAGGKPSKKHARRCVLCGKKDHTSAQCPVGKAVCWNCGVEGHMSPECPEKSGKKTSPNVVGSVTASAYPMVRVQVSSVNDNRPSLSVLAGVDTFSCASIMSVTLAEQLGCVVTSAHDAELVSLSGNKLDVVGMTTVMVKVSDREVKLPVAVLREMSLCQLLLGLDSHPRFGRYLVVDAKNGSAKFAAETVVGAVKSSIIESDMTRFRVDNEDFTAWAEPCGSKPGQKYRWLFKWKWADGKEPTGAIMDASPPMYDKKWFDESIGVMWHKETQRWIDEGVLEEETNIESVADIPLLPWNLIAQPQKKSCPLRAALDYKFLNKFVSCHSQESLNEVCLTEMRKWRCLL